MSPSDTIARLRSQALDFFRAAIAAADPSDAVARELGKRREVISQAKRVFLVGVGKAAVPMAKAALPLVHDSLTRAIVLTNPENVTAIDGVEVMAGGHPLPDAGSQAGADAIEQVARGAQAGDLVLVLVSGGGSALMAAPAGDITLDEKIALNALLIRSGADISEINTVRAAVSRLKGGGLARLAAPARLIALALSDVPGDDLSTIASGPTVPPRGNAKAALDILSRHGLMDRVPASVRRHLETAQPATADYSHAETVVAGSNALSVAAATEAATAAGWQTVAGPGWLEGEVGEVAQWFAARAAELPDGNALICGGETTVAVKGGGLGGRNQELALRVAQALTGLMRPWVFLSGGTDGRDGPTDAAGAVVDAGTLARLEVAGFDVDDVLSRNDSHPALDASGDLIRTGGTGTNVADVQILLIGREMTEAR